MIINRILTNFITMPINSCLYLVFVNNNKSGFFASNGKLIYLVSDTENFRFECIETEYLSLKTHVQIHSVENDATFKNGYYNLIEFKGIPNSTEITSFIDLCIIHSKNINELNFRDFFYSLINLFQLPKEQSFKNAVGLYGELKFMQFVKDTYNIDISKFWHKSGSYSQYDFSNGHDNLEVKSVLSEEQIVKIKHRQIFNDHHSFLVIMNCEKYENGETIDELIKTLSSCNDAFNNFNYSINLATELRRISPTDIVEIKFNITQVSIYDSNIINPFSEIPAGIIDISYIYDLSIYESMPKSSVQNMIRQFITNNTQ
ncbi:PD-(D/E)XK motif protein [Phascolarctobacterium sp.]